MGCCGDDCCVPPKESREPIHHDPNFNGPVHNRSCTDILWLILFILFLGAWGFVGFYSIRQGNMEEILAPVDSYGRWCGIDSGLEDKPYLVFFDIVQCLRPDTFIVGCPTPQVCVKKCPQKTITFDYTNFETYRSQMVCTHDVNVQTIRNFAEAEQHIKNKKCAKMVLSSQPVLRRCTMGVDEVMEVMKQVKEYSQFNSSEIASSLSALVEYNQVSARIVDDLTRSQWYLVGGLCAVVVICFIYILLLRWVVTPVVWASIAGLLALLAFSIYKCYKQYAYFKANPVQLIATTNVKGWAENLFTKHEVWMALLVAVAIIFVVLLVMVIFLRSRISLAIALIKEGSKAVYAIKTTVFVPILPWLLQCVVFAFGVVVAMALMSIGEKTFSVVNMDNDPSCDCKGVYTKDQEPCIPEAFMGNCTIRDTNYPCETALCHYSGMESSNKIMGLHLVNLLGIFWSLFFISGIADMILASTFSTWYWTMKKKDLPFFTLTAGTYRTLRYHMGTVAFGALIIAIVRVIRVILEYIDHKLKKFDNPLTRCVLCCCKCFFWCLEQFLKFINKNAYIMCAIHGKHFCASARDAFSLLLRNIVRVVVLDKVTDFIFFLSKLLISVGVGFAVYYLLTWKLVYEVTQGEQLHYNYVPTILLSVASYLVCSIFFNVYSMAVDTLFLCFLEDCERNDGSAEKPYFMSRNLMNILGKKNKRE